MQRGRDTSAEADRAPLRLSSKVTVTGAEATKDSPWCPPLGPSVGSALPSTGSSEASSPASAVLRRCATPWAPHAGLGCLRPTLPCGAPVVSLPAVQVAQPRAGGSSTGPHVRYDPQGDHQGLPGSPATLLSLCPVLRPRQDRTHQATKVCQHGPRGVHDEGSHDEILSGLNRTALGLAVYASWAGSPQHCTQDSLPAAGQALPDGIGYPQGCAERFQCIKHLLLSGAFLAQGRKSKGTGTLFRHIIYGKGACPL